MDSNEQYQKQVVDNYGKQIVDEYGDDVLEDIQDRITCEIDWVITRLQNFAYDETRKLSEKIAQELGLDSEYEHMIAYMARCNDALAVSIWEAN